MTPQSTVGSKGGLGKLGPPYVTIVPVAIIVVEPHRKPNPA